jgi:Tfp pilus assembly protein PilV
MRGRIGFSLVEVLVALVVFEVGVLGVLAMTLQAQRTLRAAVASESASRAVEWLADSLSSVAWRGPGSTETERGSIRWTRGDNNGFITVSFEGGSGASVSVGLSPGSNDEP